MGYLLDSNGARLVDAYGNFLYDSAGPPPDPLPRAWTFTKVPQLAARALRKIGVAIVANANRPSDGPTLSTSDIVARVAHALGVPVDATSRPAELGTVTGDDIAARALRRVGVNPLASYLASAATGMVWTYQQVATAALRKLGVMDAAEAAQAPDQSEAEKHALAVHDMLVSLAYVDWQPTTIPDSVAEAYIALTANLLAPMFGRPATPDAVSAAQDMVRRQALSGARGHALALSAVQSAHDSLVRFGVVDWPLNAVPVAFAEDYAGLAAAELAQVYGQPVPTDVFTPVRDKLRAAADIKAIQTRATEKVRAVYDEMNAMGIVTWPYGQVPASMADAMVQMVATMMRGDEGKLDSAAMGAAYDRIKQIAMSGPAGQALAEQKVRAVHYDLEARGKVRWSLMSIPNFAEEPYVFLTAALLAPECGVKADPNWPMQAEMTLARATSLPSTRQPVHGVYF